MNQNSPIDPLSLEPRALTILLAISRYPEGVTINKLAGQLAMAYRTIRAVCRQLATRQPPLLEVRRGLYAVYALSPTVNLNSLTQALPASQPAEIPARNRAKRLKQAVHLSVKHPRKRTNLRIGPIHIARLSLERLFEKDFNYLIKNLESLSLNHLKSLPNQADQTAGRGLSVFKNIQIASVRIDLLSIEATPQPNPSELENLPGRSVNQADEPNQPPSMLEKGRDEDEPDQSQPSQPFRLAARAYTPPDESRLIKVHLTGGAFSAMQLVHGRRLRAEEINPRHNQQYLLQSARLFEHSVLWHPSFGEIPEKTVLGWMAQALDGSQRGKITQPWGIVYRGMLGELPTQLPDKRYREEPERVLGHEFLALCGYHLEEEDLPPTPQQAPDWRPPPGGMTWEEEEEEEDEED